MNNKFPKFVWFNNFGLSCSLTFLLLGLFLGSVGLSWVINSFLILIALITIAPAIILWRIRWWLRRDLVGDKCPVCSYGFTGFNKTECQCPNCGELLKIEGGRFHRIIPSNTIDIDAVEVSSNQLED
ncbi:hypothetical protein [Cyanobacterium sp. uoEpiScrs1]|uniref:hypothetical protein n=1 Tax=Cyanobacterium sp. uoEpiScrs1 TaxID=2976343 RepID=UPI00226AC6EF|nr:hypothetical protein [Cyanobacterium sp. uoEpiScrs1]